MIIDQNFDKDLFLTSILDMDGSRGIFEVIWNLKRYQKFGEKPMEFFVRKSFGEDLLFLNILHFIYFSFAENTMFLIMFEFL